MPDEGYKRCSRCGEVKPHGEFHRRARARDGLQTWCKACYREHFASRDPDALKAKARSWYERNRERKIAYRRAHYSRAAQRAQSARWRAANPQRSREVQRRAEANRRLRGARVSGEYAAILRLDPCAYCGAPAGAIDHIVPTLAGGDGHWTNLTAVCHSCNSSKRSAPLLLWLSGHPTRA
jgi:hypothetical protein